MTPHSHSATTSAITASELQQLVEQHRGNRSAIARALGELGHTITHQGVGKMLKRHGLDDLANRMSVRTNKSGPRSLTPDEARVERRKILTALDMHGGPEGAHQALDMKIATFYRRRSRVRAELVQALLLHDGDEAAAARALDLPVAELRRGIVTLALTAEEISPPRHARKPARKSRSRAK